MEIYTIGYTKKTAEKFFGLLKHNRIKHLIDIRLNNSSQLSGFTKVDDFAYFLRELGNIEYSYEPLLTPSQEIYDNFKKKKGSWQNYKQEFNTLLEERRVEEKIGKELFYEPTVLLCSEPEPDKCHRRLVAEYLENKWGQMKIIHL